MAIIILVRRVQWLRWVVEGKDVNQWFHQGVKEYSHHLSEGWWWVNKYYSFLDYMKRGLDWLVLYLMQTRTTGDRGQYCGLLYFWGIYPCRYIWRKGMDKNINYHMDFGSKPACTNKMTEETKGLGQITENVLWIIVFFYTVSFLEIGWSKLQRILVLKLLA